MELHPETGLHYTHFVPSWPAYADADRTLRALAARTPWVTVEPLNAWAPVRDGGAFQNPQRMLIAWGGVSHDEPGPRVDRRCIIALQYSETVGDLDKLHGDQRGVLERLLMRAQKYDVILTHTPSEAQWLRAHIPGVRAHEVPLGYSPEAVGRPDFAQAKKFDIAYYGARMGRRQGLLTALQPHLRHKYDDVGGLFGLDRQAKLNEARAILQVHHCHPSCSFPSFRLWHAMATSAALLMEPADAWPAVSGRHYFEYPEFTPETADVAARAIDAILDRDDVIETARRAHDELSTYTPDYCHEKFMVPLSAELKRRSA